MMNHISKKVAFLGFLGLLLSNAPVEALRMPDVRMPSMPKMPGAPTPEFFKGWSKEALSKRVDNAGKSIQTGLKSLQACIEGKKECNRRNVWALRGAIAALTAITLLFIGEKIKPFERAREAGRATGRAAGRAARGAGERTGELLMKTSGVPFQKEPIVWTDADEAAYQREMKKQGY